MTHGWQARRLKKRVAPNISRARTAKMIERTNKIHERFMMLAERGPELPGPIEGSRIYPTG